MSPLSRLVAAVAAVHRQAVQTGIPVDEALGEREEARAAAISRRQLLRGAAAVGAGAFLSGAAVQGASAASQPTRRRASASAPRIVIVGAGLAGLRCADHLHRQGYSARIYEAATDHIGGRCWTNRGFFGGDRIAEHGGEFISSEHAHMRRLAGRFGLELENVNGGALVDPELTEVYWMDGQPYSVAEALADWGGPAHHAFHQAAGAAPWPQSWNRHTREGRRLDGLSVDEFVERAVPGGTASKLGRLLRENAISEYGGDPSVQSCLNLIAIVGYDPETEIRPLAGTDERWHVRGGNDLVVDGLQRSLPHETVRQGHELIAVRRIASDAYRCTFRHGLAHHDVTADHLVLALPFSALRNVDIGGAGFTHRKLRAIRGLELGTNAKLVVELSHRTWGPHAPAAAARGYNGTSYSAPGGFEVVWDGNVGRGPQSLLVDFLGARQGAELGVAPHGQAPATDVDRFLSRIEPLFPGTRAAFTGRAWNDTWAKDPWHHGAYAFWQTGQTTDFGGYEHVQEGNVHFAGEHTSLNFQGYMEGAVISGKRAADEILAQV